MALVGPAEQAENGLDYFRRGRELRSRKNAVCALLTRPDTTPTTSSVSSSSSASSDRPFSRGEDQGSHESGALVPVDERVIILIPPYGHPIHDGTDALWHASRSLHQV